MEGSVLIIEPFKVKLGVLVQMLLVLEADVLSASTEMLPGK